MNYIELCKKELFLRSIQYYFKTRNININFKMILKFNNTIIKATTLRNYDSKNNDAYIITDKPSSFILKDVHLPTTENLGIEEQILEYLFNTYQNNKKLFTLVLFDIIYNTNIDYFNVDKFYNIDNHYGYLFDISYINDNNKFDFIKLSETDNLEFISIKI